MYDKLAGVLLGTAVGDALGLYMEGLSSASVSSQFASGIERYYLLGNVGFVSDDTEQSALVAQALIANPPDLAKSVRTFRKSMLGWFCRMPFGVGRATSFSCLKILLGIKNTGIRSAGNGAAMRAAIIGVFFHDDPELRVQFGTGLAQVTHADMRAVEGALFVSEMAAASHNTNAADEFARHACFDQAINVVNESSLRSALISAKELSAGQASFNQACKQLGSSGFVNHSVPLATFVFLRHGDNCLTAIQSAISAGGDTDSNAAIVGAWCGALQGESGLPKSLIDQINDGPFGPTHLRKLAQALVNCKSGSAAKVPGYFWPMAFARNIALIPIILSHSVLRIARRGKLT